MMIESLELMEYGAPIVSGVLVGLSVSLYAVGNGRIAGLSGIFASALKAISLASPASLDLARIAFLAGLLASPWALRIFVPLPASQVETNPFVLAVAGLLVGYGTRLGNGCTSGHGVCGVARMSIRSIAATAVFVGFGVATTFILRHGGLR